MPVAKIRPLPVVNIPPKFLSPTATMFPLSSTRAPIGVVHVFFPEIRSILAIPPHGGLLAG